MYKKAILFGDHNAAREILSTDDPALHKAAGRKISNFQYEVWSQFRYNIMVEILNQKFEDDFLKGKLLSSGNRILVEASPEDTIRGVGLSENHPDIIDEAEWKGLNLLGKALMEVSDSKTPGI